MKLVCHQRKKDILTNSTRWRIESILTECTNVSSGSCSIRDRRDPAESCEKSWTHYWHQAPGLTAHLSYTTSEEGSQNYRSPQSQHMDCLPACHQPDGSTALQPEPASWRTLSTCRPSGSWTNCNPVITHYFFLHSFTQASTTSHTLVMIRTLTHTHTHTPLTCCCHFCAGAIRLHTKENLRTQFTFQCN